MILWAALTVMIALAVSGLTIPLVRRYDRQNGRATNLDVLKSQLGEVESQLSNGAVSGTEAEALRDEIKRRILAETRETVLPPPLIPARAMPWLALGLVAVVALAATGLYATMGHPELSTASVRASAPAAGEQAAPAQHPMGDVASMITGLQNKLQQAPNDPQGWQMLGWSYMRTGRAADAAKAYAHAVALEPANPEYLSAEAEAMVQADSGNISADAAAIFRRAAAVDPADPRTRYFLAMIREQKGDHAGAIADWITLLKTAPADAPWAPMVRDTVQSVAQENKLDISAKLPPAPPAPPADAGPSAPPPGPTAVQVAEAGKMSDSDRQAMIHSMVDQLAAQLKDNPKDSEGWLRLMRARMVLGQADQAAAAYRTARQVFADAPAELATLQTAAHGLGIPGA